MTPLEYHEVVRVERALNIARRSMRIYEFSWRGYLRKLAFELSRAFA